MSGLRSHVLLVAVKVLPPTLIVIGSFSIFFYRTFSFGKRQSELEEQKKDSYPGFLISGFRNVVIIIPGCRFFDPITEQELHSVVTASERAELVIPYMRRNQYAVYTHEASPPLFELLRVDSITAQQVSATYFVIYKLVQESAGWFGRAKGVQIESNFIPPASRNSIYRKTLNLLARNLRRSSSR